MPRGLDSPLVHWRSPSRQLGKVGIARPPVRIRRLAARPNDWEHQVIEMLAEWAEPFTEMCAECLDLIMQRERERWGLELSLAPARKVLESALKSDDPTAQRRAREVVNRRSARGYHGFRDLLG